MNFFHGNSMHFVPKGPLDDKSSLVQVPVRHQAITRTNNDQILWHHMASLGRNEFNTSCQIFSRYYAWVCWSYVNRACPPMKRLPTTSTLPACWAHKGHISFCQRFAVERMRSHTWAAQHCQQRIQIKRVSQWAAVWAHRATSCVYMLVLKPSGSKWGKLYWVCYGVMKAISLIESGK